MEELSKQDVMSIFGGKKWFSIISSALFTGTIEGIMGMFVAGPAGFIVGFGHGIYDGAAGALIYEGAKGLTETLHPELGNN